MNLSVSAPHSSGLLIAGRAVTSLDKDLLKAAKYGDHDGVVDDLIQGANPLTWNEDFRTALALVSKFGRSYYAQTEHQDDAQIANALLEAGAKVNALDSRWRTPLMEASLSLKPNTVEILLAHQADVFARDKYSHTAYSDAAWILQANPNRDEEGKSVLSLLSGSMKKTQSYVTTPDTE